MEAAASRFGNTFLQLKDHLQINEGTASLKQDQGSGMVEPESRSNSSPTSLG